MNFFPPDLPARPGTILPESLDSCIETMRTGHFFHLDAIAKHMVCFISTSSPSIWQGNMYILWERSSLNKSINYDRSIAQRASPV